MVTGKTWKAWKSPFLGQKPGNRDFDNIFSRIFPKYFLKTWKNLEKPGKWYLKIWKLKNLNLNLDSEPRQPPVTMQIYVYFFL